MFIIEIFEYYKILIIARVSHVIKKIIINFYLSFLNTQYILHVTSHPWNIAMFKHNDSIKSCVKIHRAVNWHNHRNKALVNRQWFSDETTKVRIDRSIDFMMESRGFIASV